jgi:ABC-type phosphate transport system substrate-binding protein
MRKLIALVAVAAGLALAGCGEGYLKVTCEDGSTAETKVTGDYSSSDIVDQEVSNFCEDRGLKTIREER